MNRNEGMRGLLADVVAREESERSDPIDIPQFLLGAPLYTWIDLNAHAGFQHHLINYSGHLDTYCVDCERQSVFNIASGVWLDSTSDSPKFFMRFDCSRNSRHEIAFMFAVIGNQLTKLAQYPSIAELVDPESSKYVKVLGKNGYREFKKAIGLAAHGVGVGSFVYLRRIFEQLIYGAYVVAKSEPDWNEEDWARARMDERIQLLRAQLPEFLVENRGMYGILSKGIHELTEAECLTFFEIIRGAIEIILDAKLDALAKQEKIEDIKRKMAAAQASLKAPNPNASS